MSWTWRASNSARLYNESRSATISPWSRVLPLDCGIGRAGACSSVVDVVQDLLEVFPGFALGFLVVLAQQVRGVVGDHHGDVLPLEPLAAHLGDAFLVAGEGAGGDAAERADDFGANRQNARQVVQ